MRKINSDIKSLTDQIFKAYDIRGIYPIELNEEIIFNIGVAFGLFLKKKINKDLPKIVLSSDFRLSSPNLKKYFLKGLLTEKIKIIDIGFSTTPMNYFAINYLNADGGVMITASHNPKEYNGLKLSLKNAIPIGRDSGLGEIKILFLKNYGLRIRNYKSIGKLVRKNVLNRYIDFLIKNSQISDVQYFDLNSKSKIVIDCGNGAVGHILSKLIKKLKTQYQIHKYMKFSFINLIPDGSFPNRNPDPLKENALNKLKKEVLDKKADLGIAFDADGDRVFFTDEKGNFIRPDLIFGLLIKDRFENLKKSLRYKSIKNKALKVIGDIRLTRALKELIKENKIIFKFSKIGHVFFKNKMRKENADLGGEFSGHYYFKEFFFCDSGIFAMLNILKILLSSNKKISEIIKPFRKYYQSGEINFSVFDKNKIIKKIKNYFKNLGIENIKIYNFDGLNIETPDFWFNLRPSNTEPLLRLNLEAKTKKILNKNLKLLTRLIK